MTILTRNEKIVLIGGKAIAVSAEEPSPYITLAYLSRKQGSGTSGTETRVDFYANQYTGMACKFQPSQDTTGGCQLCGTFTTSKGFTLNPTGTSRFGGAQVAGGLGVAIEGGVDYVMSSDLTGLYLDGVKKKNWSGTPGTFTSENPIGLGAASSSNLTLAAGSRFYYFEIYDFSGGEKATLARFIPVALAADETSYGWYDQINDVFYADTAHWNKPEVSA